MRGSEEQEQGKSRMLLSALAKQMGVDYVELENIEINRRALRLIPVDTARQYFALPFALVENRLHVAMLTPNDMFLVDEIKACTRMEIKPFLADGTRIGKYIDMLYSHLSDEEHAACEEMPEESQVAFDGIPYISEGQIAGSVQGRYPLAGILQSLSRNLFPGDRIGLDIGSSNIKVVHVRINKDSTLQLLDYLIIRTPRGCMKGGVIYDAEVLALELQKILQTNKLDGEAVRAVVSAHPGIRTKIITLRADMDSNMEMAIREELRRQVPADISECSLLYRVTRESIRDGQPYRRIVVTLVPNEVSTGYTRLLYRLQLRPVSAVIPFTCTTRFFHNGVRFAGSKVSDTASAAAVVDLGSETTNLSIVSEGVLDFSRVFLVGGNTLDMVVSGKTGLSPEKTEEYKKLNGLTHNPRENELEKEVTDSIRRFMEDLLGNIRRSLEFYAADCGGMKVDKLVFTGGGAALSGLCSFAEEVIGVPACTLSDIDVGHIRVHSGLDREKLHFLVNAIGVTL